MASGLLAFIIDIVISRIGEEADCDALVFRGQFDVLDECVLQCETIQLVVGCTLHIFVDLLLVRLPDGICHDFSGETGVAVAPGGLDGVEDAAGGFVERLDVEGRVRSLDRLVFGCDFSGAHRVSGRVLHREV